MEPISRAGVTALIAIFLPLSLILVVLRVWAVFLRGRGFKLHDYLIIAAEVCSLAMDALAIAALTHGSGNFSKDVSPHNLVLLNQYFVASAYLWVLGGSLAKLSVLFLTLEIFGSNVWLKRSAWIATALVLMFTVGCVLLFSLHCMPFAYQWDRSLNGHCSDITSEVRATAACNLALDVIIFLLPQPVTWGLQMSRKRKLLVSGVFFVGLLLCMVNVVRVALGSSPASGDYARDSGNDTVFVMLEVKMSIIVACLAVLRPVIAKVWSGSTTKAGTTAQYAPSSDPATAMSRAKSRRDIKSFHRIEEEMELDDRIGLATTTTATGAASEMTHEGSPSQESILGLAKTTDHPMMISVQRDVDVQLERRDGP